jgi:hypothetical protein
VFFMNRCLSILVALIASCLPALAQNIRQSGNVTPAHAACWTTNGIVQDCGNAAIPFLTSIGTVGQGQTICAWSALSTAPGSQKLCLGVFDNSPATITLQNFGTDTPQGLNFVINGTAYAFPYTVGGIVGPVSSTSGDFACWNNTVGRLLKDCGSTIAWANITSTPTTLAGYGITNARTQLTGNISYYVNGNSGGTATCGAAGVSTCAAGDDSKNCLTPATACLTLQRVYGIIDGTIDFAYQYSITVYLAHNAGTTNYALTATNGPWIGTSVISIVGDNSAADTATSIMDPALGSGVQCKDLCTLGYAHVAFVDNSANNGVAHMSVGASGNAGHIDFQNVTFGGMTIGTMLSAGALGSITATGPVTITGGAAAAIGATDGGFIDFGGQTVTITGTPAFSTAFAFLFNGGIIGATSSTFSGAATGKRCQIDGPLNLGGYDPNAVFPGNSNCIQNEYIGAIGIQNGSTFGYGTAGQVLTSGGGANALDLWGSPSIAVDGQTCTLGSTCQTAISAQSDYTATTWTPAVTTTSTAGTPAYTTQVGSYERLGRQVTVRFDITLSGWTGSPSGNVEISGLPVAAANTSNDYGTCAISNYAVTGLAASNIGITGLIAPNTSVIILYQNSNTASSLITAAQIGTTATLIGFCNYHT